jgi:hypothetical protein
MARDDSHSCIVTWMPINESWGVPDLNDNPSKRHSSPVERIAAATRGRDDVRTDGVDQLLPVDDR